MSVKVECPKCGELATAGQQCGECGLLLDLNSVKTKTVPVASVVGKPKTQKPVRVCLECTTKKTIIGRGLCGGCYQRLKKEGVLDQAYPARKSGQSKTQLQVSATVVPISVVPKKNPSSKKTDNSIRELSVKFFKRDQRLLESVVKAATFNRRSLSQEILFRLEHGVRP